MTPVLAAGFNNVAETYNVSVPQVALTTGLYMLGLGLGSVIASPTAILWGKRPVYLVAIIIFLLSSVWCALSPNCTYPSTVRVHIANIYRRLSCSGTHRPRHGSLTCGVSPISNRCRNLLPPRASISTRNIHSPFARRQEPDSTSQCGNYTVS
jgi:MFS family permease